MGISLKLIYRFTQALKRKHTDLYVFSFDPKKYFRPRKSNLVENEAGVGWEMTKTGQKPAQRRIGKI